MPSMPILIKVEQPRKWTAEDWRSLPNLRVPQHNDGYDGWQYKLLLLRCPHGVYWHDSPDPFEYGGDGEVLSLRSWYCENCTADVNYYETFAEWHKHSGLIRPRSLSKGEYRHTSKLFDSSPVYPEMFTKPIMLRDRTLTTDLRLQKDYETGQRKVETNAGFISARFGYLKAALGHGPDMEADNVRMACMAMHEGSAVGGREETYATTPWTATLPPVEGTYGEFEFFDGVHISAKNWQPTKFPIGVWRPPSTPACTILYFEDDRTIACTDERKPTPPGKYRRTGDANFSDVPAGEVIEVRRDRRSTVGATLRLLQDADRKAAAYAADNLRAYRQPPRERRWWLEEFPVFEWKGELYGVEIRNNQVVRDPSAHELSAWRNKHGTEPAKRENLVPLRRTKRWAGNWRTDQKMSKLNTRLKRRKQGRIKHPKTVYARNRVPRNLHRESSLSPRYGYLTGPTKKVRYGGL